MTDGIEDQRRVAGLVRVTVRRQLKRWRVHRIGHDDLDDLVDIVLESIYCTGKPPLAGFDAARGSEKSFIALLTVRRLIELVRTQRRRAELDAEQAALLPPNEHTSEDPESLLSYREAQLHLARTVSEHASALDRQIFEDAFVEELSHPEIAAKRNISRTRVAERVHALRKRIKRWLVEIDIFAKGGQHR
jgi:RNA polymerase sigma factor (sigma-70 family)